MYVCICRQITDHQIKDLCRDGVNSITDLRARLGVASDCGKCSKLAQRIVREHARSAPFVNAG